MDSITEKFQFFINFSGAPFNALLVLQYLENMADYKNKALDMGRAEE